MLKFRSINFLWLVLMGLTLASAWIAESTEPSLLVTMIIALVIAFKGRMVVNYFMELHNANHHIRNWMNAYFYVLPIMIVLVFLFPDVIARLTALQ